MVEDTVTGECFRADHLLEAAIDELLSNTSKLSEEQIIALQTDRNIAGSLSGADLDAKLKQYNVKAPVTGNDISNSYDFNLMFHTQIGPSGKEPGFLRPETAQGIFVNFKRLLEYNNGKLPFASSQIGTAFRNEISPRAGLLRVREFTLAEIEHFVDPEKKDHPKFASVRDVELNLFTQERQVSATGPTYIKIGDAVDQKIVNNETLGYFMARTHAFLLKVGINPKKLRFRQHLSDEMAHYAQDCWDAEIETSYGWIECVGIADRSCYDLTVHGEATNELMAAWVDFEGGPRVVEGYKIVVNKGMIGKAFKKDGQVIIKKLENSTDEEIAKYQDQLEKESKLTVEGFELAPETISFQKFEKKVSGRNVVPSVIEPSFGIGRILYCIFEHSYRERDAQRTYLSFVPILAPVKCSLLPLMQKPELLTPIPAIMQSLSRRGISCKLDDSSAKIGKRYARTDEIGIPFGITVDYETLEDGTVTLRERDTMKQVRVHIDKLPDVLYGLCNDSMLWSDVLQNFPIQETSEE